MHSNILRRLTTTAASSPARLGQSHPTASWINRLPYNDSTIIKPTNPSYRLFSQTTPVSASLFRLSSKNTTTTSTTPDLGPDGEPLPYSSSYKPKRQWPPDMSKLSPKHQFRLERKYRRRAALKYARPKWTKATKLAQWGIIGFVVAYAMLFMQWDERGSPFDEIRRAFFSGVKETFSTPPPPRPVKRSDDTPRE